MADDVSRREGESPEEWLERIKGGLVKKSEPKPEEFGSRTPRPLYLNPPVEKPGGPSWPCEWCGGKIVPFHDRGARRRFDSELCRDKARTMAVAQRYLQERVHDREIGARTWDVKL